MTHDSDPGQASGATTIAELGDLDDEGYSAFVRGHLHTGCAQVWRDCLLAAELAERTLHALLDAKSEAAAVSTDRKARLAKLRADHEEGHIGVAEFEVAAARLDCKRGRHARFQHLVETRLRQTKAALKDLKRAAHQARQARGNDQARPVLRRLALAIAQHRAQLLAHGEQPADYDHTLWRHLDQEHLAFQGQELALGDAIDAGIWSS